MNAIRRSPTLTSTLVVLMCILQAQICTARADIGFENVTAQAGFRHIGPSDGSSWGDFNGDEWPDLWVNNHWQKSALYLNVGDGTFKNIMPQVWPGNVAIDTHGVAWVDFDNDGDQDVLELLGGQHGAGRNANHFLINSGGLLEDQAASWNLDYPLGRGRTPLWLDFNGDGALDVILANARRPDGQANTALFLQDHDSFVLSNALPNLGSRGNNEYAQLADVSGNHSLDLLLHGGPFPRRVYSNDGSDWVDRSDDLILPTAWVVSDSVTADFNSDLLTDVFYVRYKALSAYNQIAPNRLEARLELDGDEKGLQFKGGTNLSIVLKPRKSIFEVFIGEDGVHPTNFPVVLSADDISSSGIAPHIPGQSYGIYIGYLPDEGVWQVLLSSPGWGEVNFVVTSDSPITEVAPINFDERKVSGQLLMRAGAGFLDATKGSGLDESIQCQSGVGADFDNDMDIDLYLVCTSPVENTPNLLYENISGDYFARVENAGGAVGSSEGRGDSVTVADYDLDGFVDLFVTNGSKNGPFNDGPDQIFRNIGNENRWLEVDLAGTMSNRDGIGARIELTAGGVTQLREQAGGMHRLSQNHQRIHFGLADNEVVDQLTIEWPSGIVQIIDNIPANQIIRVVEPSLPSVLGRPQYQSGTDNGLYLWKNTIDGPYHLRVSGNGSHASFTVQIIAEAPFGMVTPYRVESNDALAWNDNHIFFIGQVSTGEDGFDFQLPPNTNALISVEQDGVPNPRQLHIGSSGQPLAPSGWIVDADALPELPSFQVGEDLGFYIGQDPLSGDLAVRWTGDGRSHTTEVALLYSARAANITPVSLEKNDSLYSSAYSLQSDGIVNIGVDGVNVTTLPKTIVGFAPRQDALFQAHRVNRNTQNFNLPNAYWLPYADASGAPDYDAAADKALFLWKDGTGMWHLRGTAGGGQAQYTGSITSSEAAINVVPVMLEVDDLLDSIDPTHITFDLQMVQRWQDGIDLRFPENARLCIDSQASESQTILVGVNRIAKVPPFDLQTLGPCDADLRY